MSNRKQMRVTIPADQVAAFKRAKERAEKEAMITLTDTQYASRLIQWAIKTKL
jgi:hypothetical protein